MATKSFIKEFAIDRRNARLAAKGLFASKPISFIVDQRVENIKKDQIRKFFDLDNK